ncbi:32245_t:CDS:2, partial [Racocetra persica]
GQELNNVEKKVQNIRASFEDIYHNYYFSLKQNLTNIENITCDVFCKVKQYFDGQVAGGSTHVLDW